MRRRARETVGNTNMVRDRVSFALLVVGYASVAAYVAGQVWASLDAASLERAIPFDARWVGVPGAVCAAVEAGRTLRVASQGQGGGVRGGKKRWLPPAYPLYATAALATAGWAGVVGAFGAAFVLTLWILAVIDEAGKREMVMYEHQGVRFFASRCTLYASGRAAAAAATAHLGLPVEAARLAWFWVATAETVGMTISVDGSYSFSVGSKSFAAYALLKSALFLAAPLVEEAVVGL